MKNTVIPGRRPDEDETNVRPNRFHNALLATGSLWALSAAVVSPAGVHAAPAESPSATPTQAPSTRQPGEPATSQELPASPPTSPRDVPAPIVGSQAQNGVRVDEALPDYEDPVARALDRQPQGLTAEAVAARASVHAPGVDVARAQLQAAAAQVDQAMVAFFPQLILSASYTRLSDVNVTFGDGALVGAQNAGPLGVGPCPDGSAGCVVDSGGSPVFASTFDIPQVLDQFSLQARLSVPISDYVFGLVQARKAALANRQAKALAQEAELLKVQVNSQLAYYDWLRAVAQVAIAQRTLADSRRRYEDAEASYAVGIIGKADLLRISALVANAENAIAQSRAMEQVAEANLAVLMQETPRDYAVGEDVFELERRPPAESVQELVSEAHEKRLELRALSQSSEALHRATKAERLGYYPRLNAFAEGIYANPNPRFFPPTEEWNATWLAGVSLGYVINQPFITRARVKELTANRRELEANLEALRRGITMEVTSAYADYQRASASIAAVGRAREASEEAYRVAADLYHYGKNTTTDLIAAESERVAATLRDVNAHIDLRVARIKLEYSTGRMQPLAASERPAATK